MLCTSRTLGQIFPVEQNVMEDKHTAVCGVQNWRMYCVSKYAPPSGFHCPSSLLLHVIATLYFAFLYIARCSLFLYGM